MTKYASFLRGINVGSKNKLPMEDLRKMAVSLGFENVKTYINSGNLIFETVETDDNELSKTLETTIQETFSLNIKVISRPISHIENLIKINPFAGKFANDKDIHVFFLDEVMPTEKREMLIANNTENEIYVVIDREIFCHLRIGVLESLMGKDYIAKKLKISSTARNWRTVNKILEL